MLVEEVELSDEGLMFYGLAQASSMTTLLFLWRDSWKLQDSLYKASATSVLKEPHMFTNHLTICQE